MVTAVQSQEDECGCRLQPFEKDGSAIVLQDAHDALACKRLQDVTTTPFIATLTNYFQHDPLFASPAKAEDRARGVERPFDGDVPLTSIMLETPANIVSTNADL
jgi:hypothetical protein